MLLLWHALRYRLCLWRSRYVWLGSVTCSLILVVALLWPTSLSASGRSVSGLSASERSVSERSVFGPPTPLVGWQPAASLQKAQQLNKQGQQAFNQGLSEMALAYWQQAEQQYREAADDLGVLGTQLNQGKALLELGFYRRADGLLQPLVERLEAAPTSLLKVNVWLTFGKKERLLGHLSTAKTYLSEGLVMSQALGDRTHQQAAHLYLGNALTAEQQWPAAMAEYQLAASIAGPLQLSSQLHQLQLLPALGQARQLASQVQAFVLQLEHTASVADDAMLMRTRTYLMLDLSRWLMQHSPETFAELTEAPAAFFSRVIEQGRAQGDRRAEAYGWGYWGHWAEQQAQWESAAQKTQKALALSQGLQANELVYQWQWQQGRIARAQGDSFQAIASYTAAVETLKPLRQEIVAITRTVQFSFRDQLEPIYRDLVDLLLSPSALAKSEQASLEKARQVLEALQLAELNNFFREPCLDSIPQPLESIDPTAAIFYPIVLDDRLSVIVSIPGQKLSYFTTPIAKATLETGMRQMLDSMRSTSFEAERLSASQQLYQWLIAPGASILRANDIESLVFVLNDSLRNLPVGALYSGKHYLVEEYSLSISPGLQLLQVTQAQGDFSQPRALVGGLSLGKRDRPALIGVQTEVSYVKTLLDAKVLLNEAFTKDALFDQVDRRSFDIVHLATHARFGQSDADTFIETWDGTLPIHQLRQLLKQQDTRGLPPSLLILSACDTAQGDDRAVLGMAGLAVRSGAQSTLATLWSVNDRATATFVQQFYDGLVVQGLTKAEAVRYAQRQLIQTPSLQHPYYWAPFVLVGDWT